MTCNEGCREDPDTLCHVGGIPIAWRGRCVSYSIQHDVPPNIGYQAAKAAIDTSFRTWQDVVCPGTSLAPSISAVGEGFSPVTCAHVEYNRAQSNANIIVFRDESLTDEKGNHPLALTTVTFNVRTGDIYDADMEIDSALVSSGTSGPYDLQAVVTHEAGHFMGLAHSMEPGATMVEFYDPHMRGLGPDDIAGICTAYPPDRSAGQCDPNPRQGFSPECALDPIVGQGCSVAARAGHATARDWALALALSAAVTAAARRRRSPA